jgi:hypothetical protein
MGPWELQLKETPMKKTLFKFLLNRLKEASTYRGLTLLCTALGVALSPAQGEAIVAAGIALAGVLGAFLPDGGAQ